MRGPAHTPAAWRAPIAAASYVAHAVPGLRGFELGGADPPDGGGDAWAGALRRCRIRVADPQGRFLPMEFDAGLPARGLLDGTALGLAPLPLSPGGESPPRRVRIPLFSAPGRPLPDPLAVVRAQLRQAGTGLAAAWALLGVSIEGRLRGLGLADPQGRVAVMFPYPEPPRRQLASPPEARDDFSWPLELQAYSAPPASPAQAWADLEAVLMQLGHPRRVVAPTAAPPHSAVALPLRLAYRVPLTVRSAGTGPGDASYLLVT